MGVNLYTNFTNLVVNTGVGFILAKYGSKLLGP